MVVATLGTCVMVVQFFFSRGTHPMSALVFLGRHNATITAFRVPVLHMPGVSFVPVIQIESTFREA